MDISKEGPLCPVMSARLLVEPSIDLTPGKLELGPVILPCAKEKCAWWDAKRDRCAILTSTISLVSIYAALVGQNQQSKDLFCE